MALLSRYETYNQLGKGSTGTIFRARDVVLGQEVALRILNAQSRFSYRLVDLFFTDEQAASEWLHPNIATIHDLGQSSAGPFAATELLTGATMRSHIQNHGKFSLIQKLDLLIQACNGLAHAHMKGVIHAAITPGSFLITDKQQVKILDLGIRHVGQSIAVARTERNLVYLAPEQVWEQSCTARSDLFSAAVVFYEFLVNAHPFPNGVAPRPGLADSADHIVVPEGAIPESLERVMRKALSASPDDRPQSAFELAASFRAIELEISSPLMHRFGDRPRFADRPHASPDKSWEGHSNVRAFLELLRHFEENLASGKLVEAQQYLQRMKGWSAPDNEEFIPAILESEQRLLRAQQPAVAQVITTAERVPDAERPTGRPLAPPPVEPPLDLVKHVKTRLLGLSPIRLQVIGTVVVAILLLLAAFFASHPKQGPGKQILARAQVNVPETNILESSNAGSRSVATLQKGTWVNILDHIPTQKQGFVHVVETGPDKQDLPSGYIQVADLDNWRSDDSNVAYSLLALDKPASNLELAGIEQYLGRLQSYRAQFPKSDQTQAVDAETEHWREVLTYAPKPPSGSFSNLVSLPAGEATPAPNPTLVASAEALLPADREKLKRILDRMSSLWEEGNLEGIMEQSQLVMAIDPENAQAKMWRSKARKALRKLGDQ